MIYNPFTPKSGIEPRFFMGREKEVEFFKKALKDTEAGRPSHFIVIGGWGSGKTSLLREFKKIAQQEGSVCSFVSMRGFEGRDTLRDSIEYLVGEVAIRLPLDVSKLTKFTKELNSVGVSIAGTGFQFSKDIIRGDPQTFFYSNMLNLWSDLKNETKVVVVLIDDVQNLNSVSVAMSVIRNTLADEKIVKETKFLFVLASTPDGWKPFLQRDHPIGRYFTPRMKLTNLSEAETTKLIETYLKGSGVKFSQEVKKKVFAYTRGHLYETQVLCNHLFENQLKGEVKGDAFEPALITTLETLGEEIFDNLYDSASEREKRVLGIVAILGENTHLNGITKEAKERHQISYDAVCVSLERLVNKGIINKAHRSVYTIEDTLFRTYIVKVR
ncbi:MAG: BREX system ATP-binding domain-containing protein [Candidatus Micrarchaeota archaeon]